MASKWLWCINFFALSALAVEVRPSLTFQASQTTVDRLSPGGQVVWGGDRWEGAAGFRVGLSPTTPQLDLAAFGGWRPPGPIGLRFRVHHQWLDAGTQTVLALTLAGGTHPRAGFRPFGELGIARRYFRIGGAVPFPGPWGHDTNEWDAVVRLGLQLPALGGISPRLGVTTLDRVEIYRLNNPAAEVGASWQGERATWDLSVRYRLILGFGRVDEVAIRLSANLTH